MTVGEILPLFFSAKFSVAFSANSNIYRSYPMLELFLLLYAK